MLQQALVNFFVLRLIAEHPIYTVNTAGVEIYRVVVNERNDILQNIIVEQLENRALWIAANLRRERGIEGVKSAARLVEVVARCEITNRIEFSASDILATLAMRSGVF